MGCPKGSPFSITIFNKLYKQDRVQFQNGTVCVGGESYYSKVFLLD